MPRIENPETSSVLVQRPAPDDSPRRSPRSLYVPITLTLVVASSIALRAALIDYPGLLLAIVALILLISSHFNRR